jgi:hypothetical protein
MEAMRETWTDARLSDFAAHTDSRFDAVDRRFEAVERRMDEGFRRVDADLRALNGRFDALQRTMLQLGGGVIVALIGLIATQL